MKPCKGSCTSNVLVVIESADSRMTVPTLKCISDHSHSDSDATPSVPDMLNKFHGETVYSTFDIIKALHDVPVAEENRKCTAFTKKRSTFV